MLVERVLFEGKRAIGARIVRGDDSGGAGEALHAAHVIVCAGAIHSPALLLRSGIGPAAELAALGIEVRCAIGRASAAI